ncbi:hypothetical protein ACFV4N_02750 [Actinosynnema sp. NPDC059797]
MGPVPLVEPEAEGMSPTARRALQERRLRRLLTLLLDAGGVQAERLRDVGVARARDVRLTTCRRCRS